MNTREKFINLLIAYYETFSWERVDSTPNGARYRAHVLDSLTVFVSCSYSEDEHDKEYCVTIGLKDGNVVRFTGSIAEDMYKRIDVLYHDYKNENLYKEALGILETYQKNYSESLKEKK